MLSYPIAESGNKEEKLKSVTRESNPHSYVLCFTNTLQPDLSGHSILRQ